MTKRLSKVAFFVSFILLNSSRAYPCTPCSDVLDLKETIERSEVIVVGQRRDTVKTENAEGLKKRGPDTVNVKVSKVLKGKSGPSVITVNSWDGECPYGVVLEDNAPHLLFLVKKAGFYDSVAQGCSVRSLPILNDQVPIDGRMMSIQEFKKAHGL